MNILVLGGTGFIGSHLVDFLVAGGHEVRVFARSGEHFRAPIPGVDYRQAAFSDIPALAEAISGVDLVYHLVSTTVPATANRDPIFDIESNLVTTVRFLDLAAASGVKKLVYLSSGGTVYGVPETLPIPENHALAPICSYGIIKVAIEGYLRRFARSHGLKSVVIRPANPYGPRQGHFGVQGVVGTFLSRVKRGEALEVWGDGTTVRDYLYVKDLARFCHDAGMSERTGTYNCGSGSGCSINRLIGIIREISGRNVAVNYHPARGFDLPEVVLDIGKSAADFGWNPQTALEEGIRLTWEEMGVPVG